MRGKKSYYVRPFEREVLSSSVNAVIVSLFVSNTKQRWHLSLWQASFFFFLWQTTVQDPIRDCVYPCRLLLSRCQTRVRYSMWHEHLFHEYFIWTFAQFPKGIKLYMHCPGAFNVNLNNRAYARYTKYCCQPQTSSISWTLLSTIYFLVLVEFGEPSVLLQSTVMVQ